ncbi:MAG: hypothetical protein V3T98_01160, partial [Candidatus Paceibacterota bacterium]
MIIQNWTDVVVGSLQNLWGTVAGFLPSLIGALIIIIIGLIVAAVLASLVERLIGALKIDSLLKTLRLSPYFERAGLQMNAGRFLGRLVYWFLVIAFILAASDILGFWALSGFLTDVLLYIPNIIIAVLIMLAAVVLGSFLRSLVRSSVTASKLHASKFLGTLTWWSVIVFGLLAALTQLGIAVAIINTLITGLIAMIALAGGIAFGLGGKDYAASLIEKLKRET